ncbi:DUF4229 domain-containing protein [Streptomyces bambusae]|uniref:DUF4229 domain-containing protein n=1 Tax=Streptomyces bambusae TaxID=1550616 RepID=UPI001CFDA8C8|nr:DUF4229 domain-containing protein [Streptomyces bambusae]MCB5169029.1 DUF4229 domain-containing protein [Streptomyces bambusae]
MRLGIFFACLVAVLGLVELGVLPSGIGDANYIWVVLLALLISAPLSLVLLRKQRDEMSQQITPKVEGVRSRLSANRNQEDEADDAARTS